MTRWRLYHPGFQATLNERRAAVWQSSEDAYRVLLYDAVGVLKDELRTPGPQRAKIALALVRATRLPRSDLAHPGPTDPEAIVDEVVTRNSPHNPDRPIYSVSDSERQVALKDLLSRANERPPDDPRPDPTE